MKMTIAAKRIGATWEGALIVDNKFQRALTGEKLEDVVLRGLVGLMTPEHSEGTDVMIEVLCETPGEVKSGS
jgi:hypothetical protein